MNRGAMPICQHAFINTSASNTPMWFAAITTGPFRSSSGTPPLTVRLPTIDTA